MVFETRYQRSRLGKQIEPIYKFLGIYTFTASFVPHLKIPRNPKNRFCSTKVLNHPYYFNPLINCSRFKIPSRGSLTEYLLKSFLFINIISGLIAEKAAKQVSSRNFIAESTRA